MGSSASKGTRAAASNVRKYPSRPSGATSRASAPPAAQPARPRPAPPSQSTSQASPNKSHVIDLDGRDPGLASRLNQLGAVQPNPHFSPSSTSNLDPRRNQSSEFSSDMMQSPPQSAFPDPRDNPALRVLEARQRIQEEGDQELESVGRRGFVGRKYVDAGTIQLALMRKERGEPDARIEEAYGLQPGRLSALGKGIVRSVS